jgi:hypothetical protein
VFDKVFMALICNKWVYKIVNLGFVEKNNNNDDKLEMKMMQ